MDYLGYFLSFALGLISGVMLQYHEIILKSRAKKKAQSLHVKNAIDTVKERDSDLLAELLRDFKNVEQQSIRMCFVVPDSGQKIRSPEKGFEYYLREHPNVVSIFRGLVAEGLMDQVGDKEPAPGAGWVYHFQARDELVRELRKY